MRLVFVVLERHIYDGIASVNRERMGCNHIHMRQTMCYVDTALLAQIHGMSIDGKRLQCAAQNCLIYGYGHQAEKLLAMPDIHTWLSEDELLNLASLLQEENI